MATPPLKHLCKKANAYSRSRNLMHCSQCPYQHPHLDCWFSKINVSKVLYFKFSISLWMNLAGTRSVRQDSGNVCWNLTYWNPTNLPLTALTLGLTGPFPFEFTAGTWGWTHIRCCSCPTRWRYVLLQAYLVHSAAWDIMIIMGMYTEQNRNIYSWLRIKTRSAWWAQTIPWFPSVRDPMP